MCLAVVLLHGAQNKCQQLQIRGGKPDLCGDLVPGLALLTCSSFSSPP